MREEHCEDWNVDEDHEHGQVQGLVSNGVNSFFMLCCYAPYNFDCIGNGPRNVRNYKAPVNKMDASLFLFKAAFISLFCLLFKEMHDFTSLLNQAKINNKRCCNPFSIVYSIELMVDIRA